MHGSARAIAVRAATAAGIAALVGLLVLAAYAGLASRGYRFDFSFLGRAAGIQISEGSTPALRDGQPTLAPFESSDSNAQALATGCFNTLKVTLVAIVASTVIGIGVALGRLSTNWLLRQLCFLYVEAIRNTPLLIQLVFWYFAVLLKLPPVEHAADLYGLLIASQQGLALPAIGFGPGLQLHLELPAVDRFGVTGGARVSPELGALFLALAINTAAFIAEAIRGAIEALPRGQWEAAAALGLGRRATQFDVVVPQVFRIVLPTLGNQYISLAKSTSFGIAVGYPDLFNVYGSVANQTGRTLEGMAIVLSVYLVLSWSISAAVNALNRRLAARGGAS